MAIIIDGNVTPTAGSVATGNGTTLNFTSAGTSGQILVSNGSSAPSFSSTIASPTLTAPTITNYTETLYSVTGSSTLSLSNGTIQKVTTSGSTTITLPASVSGKSFTVIVSYAAADSVSWAGGTTLKWANGTTPSATSATGKFDVFNFVQDGTNTYGSVFGQNY